MTLPWDTLLAKHYDTQSSSQKIFLGIFVSSTTIYNDSLTNIYYPILLTNYYQVLHKKKITYFHKFDNIPNSYRHRWSLEFQIPKYLIGFRNLYSILLHCMRIHRSNAWAFLTLLKLRVPDLISQSKGKSQAEIN